jgi:predicted amidohydrolase
MAQFNIALLQMTSCGSNSDENIAKGEAFCRRAAAMGAGIALFPEMWSNGYTFFDPAQAGAREAWAAQAVGPDDHFVTHFRSLARELDMAIAVTYLEKWPGAPRNSVSIIDRRGEIVLTYAKVHTCDFDIECELTPGDDFKVCTLDTEAGPVKVGAMICYDREFPESARVLMLQGAEIILTPNSCPMGINRLTQFRVRALENMVGVALTNYAAPQENGHSVAFDPIGYVGEDGPWRDTLIIGAGESEDIYLARFDLDVLREYRRRETWGNAFRKPRAYRMLTSLEVEPPFVRPEDRR